MRNLWILVTFIFIGISCKPDKNTFVIEGQLSGLNAPYVYLVHPEDQNGKIDTLKVKGGKFIIKGKIQNPNDYLLAFGEEYAPVEIFLEPGIFKVTGDLNDFNQIKVTGGNLQSDYNQFVEQTRQLNDDYSTVYEHLMHARMTQQEDETALIANQLDSIKDLYYESTYQFLEKKPVTILTAKLIDQILMANPDINRLQPLVNKFDDYVKSTPYGQRIINSFDIMKKTAVGTPAPLFSLKNMQGDSISLESLRGKYVLMDFWASWCTPCRDENPRMLKIYNQYKSNKFDILGVSIDQSESKWKYAVEQDKLSWPQVIDDQNISNRLYGILAIPSNILVDPQGNIIAKNLFGKKLEAKLQEIL